MPEEIKKILSNFNLKANNQLFTFLICLLIATVLWLVKSLEKDYTSTVSIPVHYTEIPKNKILLNSPPTKLNIKIKAQGFSLLRHKVGLSLSPVNFDVSSLNNHLSIQKNIVSYYFLSSQFIPQISSQISSSISIIDISPDTLFFDFDKIKEKKVPVSARIDVSFQTNYFYSDSIKLRPDNILVTGPSSILDSLKCVYTKHLKLNKLDKSFKEDVPLEKIDQIEFSTDKIEVLIPVSQQKNNGKNN